MLYDQRELHQLKRLTLDAAHYFVVGTSPAKPARDLLEKIRVATGNWTRGEIKPYSDPLLIGLAVCYGLHFTPNPNLISEENKLLAEVARKFEQEYTSAIDAKNTDSEASNRIVNYCCAVYDSIREQIRSESNPNGSALAA